MSNRVYLSAYDPRRDRTPGSTNLGEMGVRGPQLESAYIVPFAWLALFAKDSIVVRRDGTLWLVTPTDEARRRLAARRRMVREATPVDERYVLHAFETRLVPSLQPSIVVRLDELVWEGERPGTFHFFLADALAAFDDPARQDQLHRTIQQITGDRRDAAALYGHGDHWPPAKTPDDEARERLRVSHDADPYFAARIYHPGEVFVHPSFGYGIVETVVDDRAIEVVFDDGKRRIAHNQI